MDKNINTIKTIEDFENVAIKYDPKTITNEQKDKINNWARELTGQSIKFMNWNIPDKFISVTNLDCYIDTFIVLLGGEEKYTIISLEDFLCEKEKPVIEQLQELEDKLLSLFGVENKKLKVGDIVENEAIKDVVIDVNGILTTINSKNNQPLYVHDNIKIVGNIYDLMNNQTNEKPVLQQLQELADELNKDNPVDWNNWDTEKYFLFYNYDFKKIVLDDCRHNKIQGCIYCTNKDFLDIAKKRIGEDKLLSLFGVENKIEAKVGQLCWFSEKEDSPEIGILKEIYNGYRDGYGNCWEKCKPLTKEEIQVYLDLTEE